MSSKATKFRDDFITVLKSRPVFNYDGGVNEFDKTKRDIYRIAEVTEAGHLQLRQQIVEPEIALKLAAWLIETFKEPKETKDEPTATERPDELGLGKASGKTKGPKGKPKRGRTKDV